MVKKIAAIFFAFFLIFSGVSFAESVSSPTKHIDGYIVVGHGYGLYNNNVDYSVVKPTFKLTSESLPFSLSIEPGIYSDNTGYGGVGLDLVLQKVVNLGPVQVMLNPIGLGIIKMCRGNVQDADGSHPALTRYFFQDTKFQYGVGIIFPAGETRISTEIRSLMGQHREDDHYLFLIGFKKY